MKFRVNDDFAIVRAEQSETSRMKRSLEPRQQLGECPVSADGKWLAVDVGPLDEDKGFVLKASCVEIAAGAVEPRPSVEPRGIVQKCVLAEVAFNKVKTVEPNFVLADFLVARAIMETGMSNAGPTIPGSDAVGPMQVSTKEWENFRKNGGTLGTNADDSDRDHPILQIDAAVFRMHTDRKALSGLRTEPGSSDPFVPQLLDIWSAYLTDSPAAALAIRSAHETSSNLKLPFTKFLRTTLADAEVTALHKARGEKFFGTEAPKSDATEADAAKGEKSLDQVVTAIEKALDDALKQAFDKIKEFIPEGVAMISVAEPGGGGTSFAEKAPGIMRELISTFGFKDFQAAGILGNFGRETGGFTLFQERHPREGNGGIGWAQWTGGRRTNFENFCRDKGIDPRSDAANLGFLKKEMQEEPENKVVAPLLGTRKIETATERFMTIYERPGVKALAERQTWARRALAAFNGVGTEGTSAHSLQELISAGRIIFDSNSAALKNELLGLNTGVKVAPKLQALIMKLCDLTPQIRISGLLRDDPHSLHTRGRAVDIGNQEIARDLLPLVATEAKVAELGIDELIFDARLIGAEMNAFNFNEGRRHPFDLETIADHRDHIHFAVTQ